MMQCQASKLPSALCPLRIFASLRVPRSVRASFHRHSWVTVTVRGGAEAAEGGLDEGLPGGEVGDTAGLGPVGAPIVGEGAVGEDAATSTTSLARGSSSGFATVTV